MKWTTLIGASLSRCGRKRSARLMRAGPVVAGREAQPAPDTTKHVEPAERAIEEFERPATTRAHHLDHPDQPVRERKRHRLAQHSPRELACNGARVVIAS